MHLTHHNWTVHSPKIWILNRIYWNRQNGDVPCPEQRWLSRQLFLCMFVANGSMMIWSMFTQNLLWHMWLILKLFTLNRMKLWVSEYNNDDGLNGRSAFPNLAAIFEFVFICGYPFLDAFLVHNLHWLSSFCWEFASILSRINFLSSNVSLCGSNVTESSILNMKTCENRC